MLKTAVSFTGFRIPFFKYCDGKRKKIHYLKSVNYDKQSLALSVYSIDLELEGFETLNNSRLVDEN